MKGASAALGRRQRVRPRVRRRVEHELVLRETDDGGGFDFLEFVPAPRSAAALAALSARVNWYLHEREVPVYAAGAWGRQLAPGDAPGMDPALVRDPGWERHRPPGRPLTVLHEVTPAGIARWARSDQRALAPPGLYYLSERGFFRLMRRVGRARPPAPDESFARLAARAAGARSALTLATGPSARTLDLAAVDQALRITCNSAVRDDELLTALAPQVVVFADPVFHFGPSRYAAAFRRDLLSALERHRPLLVTSVDWVEPLLVHHPDVTEHLAVFPFAEPGRWCWPTAEHPLIPATGNVLTNGMLPCAFAFAEHVAIAGADGRKPQERYYWRHNARTQYSDELMQAAFEAHPAFFRDTSYEQYYDLHCRQLEAYLTAAERAGRTVTAATGSWIPALRARGASDPPD